MQNTPFRVGPVAIGTSAANLLNPPTLTGGVGIDLANTFLLVKHIRVVNTTGSPVNLSMFIGATGASASGTELGASATPVPANGAFDFYAPGGQRLDPADFLTALGSAAGLVATIVGEIGAAP